MAQRFLMALLTRFLSQTWPQIHQSFVIKLFTREAPEKTGRRLVLFTLTSLLGSRRSVLISFSSQKLLALADVSPFRSSTLWIAAQVKCSCGARTMDAEREMQMLLRASWGFPLLAWKGPLKVRFDKPGLEPGLLLGPKPDSASSCRVGAKRHSDRI